MGNTFPAYWHYQRRCPSLAVSELCYHYDISRKTGYKWIDRYLADGASGLADRSRRPHVCPHQTPLKLVEAILEARHHHPTWGAKKLLKIRVARQPNCDWPSRTAVCDRFQDRATRGGYQYRETMRLVAA